MDSKAPIRLWRRKTSIGRHSLPRGRGEACLPLLVLHRAKAQRYREAHEGRGA